MEGITVLKQDVINIAKILSKVDRAMEDNKISFGEAIGLAMELPKVFTIVKTYKSAIQEIKDLDDAEMMEITNAFSLEFDLRNDVAELMVEQILEVIVTLVATMINSKNIQ